MCRVPSQSGNTPVDLPDTTLYDYPSVGQIAQALREENIIPIFAAQEDVMDFYTVRHQIIWTPECVAIFTQLAGILFATMQALVSELGDGASAGTLEEDSGNVVDLVRTQYNVR